ncbi:MAG TPA: hypothetical protein VNN79_23205 [Actinomycetota bacterium]|nr:hypothetical protein [Actinomycetota bacterium]
MDTHVNAGLTREEMVMLERAQSEPGASDEEKAQWWSDNANRGAPILETFARLA